MRNDDKITLQNNVYSVVRRSERSQDSNRSEDSQALQDTSLYNGDLTTPHYAGTDTVVRADQDNKPDHKNLTTPHYGYYTKSQKNERGLRQFCNCGQNATIYTSDSAYCETCWNNKS